MAGSRKEYELLFKLKAALGGNFNSTFQTALKTTRELQGTIQKVNGLQSKIGGFQKQSAAIAANKDKLALLNEEHEKLQQEMSRTEQPSESLRKKFERNQRQIEQTTRTIEEQERQLGELGDDLRRAGVNTDNLEGANDRLKRSYDRLKKSQEEYARINAAQQKNNEAIAKTKGQLTGTLGAVAAIGAAIYAGPVKSSMEFESAMADVTKVVDGLKDGTTGKLTQAYHEMKQEILDLSTKIPMTTKGLTEIAAAAGQAGIARKEIIPFAEDAAKMGIAFDTTAEQAGDWMAQWRTAFKFNQKQVVELADKINYLGNTSAANALQVSEIVSRVGSMGEMAGLSVGEVAAMGATLAAMGVQEEVAATGIKKVMTVMTAGSAVTKRQQGVLDKLGISATELAERMQVDAQGAILDFIGAINSLPKAEQAAALKNYFGEEAIQSIAKLTTNTEYLKEQFEKVGDATKYAGSMEAEYAARADTTANKTQLAKNSISKLCIVLGDAFLPYVGEVAEKLSELVNRFADWASKNPGLLRTITKVIGGLLLFKAGALGLKLGFLELKGGVLGVQKVFALFKGRVAQAGVESIGLVGKLKGAGAGILGYFRNVGGAVGNLFGGSRLGAAIASIGSKLKGGVLGAFSAVGGKIGGIFGKLGGLIVNGPLGKLGSIIGKGFGSVKTFLAPVTNVISTAFAPLGKLGSTIFGGFGGLLGKILPVVGVIGLIVAAVQILMDHLEEVRGFIGKVFGPGGLAVFDKVVEVITHIGEVIKGVFSEGNLAGARDFIRNIFGENGVAVFDGLVNILQTVWGVIQGFCEFINTNVKPIVEDIFGFIVNEVLPVIAQKFAEWAPTISSIIEGLGTVIGNVATVIMNVVNFLMPTIKAIIGGALDSIMGIIGGLLNVIKGVIDFVVGVFTGDWKKAWEGVKNIFGGIWESLKALVKAPVNFIISCINTLIRGLNKLKIPDWVPGIGGKGINIPEIPQFARGTNRTPDTFIAGERGAELITNAKNRAVFTAAQTGKIADNVQGVQQVVMMAPALQAMLAGARAAAVATGAGAARLQPATVTAGAVQGGTSIQIDNHPTIVVDGSRPDDLDEKLRRNNEDLLNQLRKQADDERRGRYD